MDRSSLTQEARILYKDQNDINSTTIFYKLLTNNFQIAALSAFLCKVAVFPFQLVALKKKASLSRMTISEMFKESKNKVYARYVLAVDYLGYPFSQGLLFMTYEALKYKIKAEQQNDQMLYFLAAGISGLTTYPLSHKIVGYFGNIIGQGIQSPESQKLNLRKILVNVVPYRSAYFGMFQHYRRTTAVQNLAKKQPFFSYLCCGFLGTFSAILVQSFITNIDRIYQIHTHSQNKKGFPQTLAGLLKNRGLLSVFPQLRLPQLYLRCQNGALSIALFYYLKEKYFEINKNQ